MFEAYAYRTTARFGSRLLLNFNDGTLTISGPRIGPIAYNIWIISQIIFLVLIVLAIIIPLLIHKPKFIWLVVLIFFIHGGIGGFGAAGLWEVTNLISLGAESGQNKEIIQVSEIKDVRIGTGWARGIIWAVIPQYIPLINNMGKDMIVSFEAPDSLTGKNVVYALYMKSKEDATKLTEMLQK